MALLRLAKALAAAAALAGTGCDRTDVDRLASAGRVAADKVRTSLPGQAVDWNVALEALRHAGEDDSPVARVRRRVEHDRYLKAWNLRITGEGTTVRVAGTVGDPILKQRALDLAESTVGVEKVADEVEVKKN